MAAPQSYKNHTRFDPLFHYFLLPILLANIVITIVWYVRHRADFVHIGLWLIVMSLAFIVLAGVARSSALRAQDRVIRLEERLRLASLVSPSELAELDSLSIKQLIALRFASNPELPELARRAVRENLTPQQIKQSIRVWRADEYRV
jgi:hypothetical protein